MTPNKCHPSRTRHLCKLADAVEAAETRRLAASSTDERAAAETELKLAFDALYSYYLRFPFQIRLDDTTRPKARRLVAIWSDLIHRITIQIHFEETEASNHSLFHLLEMANATR